MPNPQYFIAALPDFSADFYKKVELLYRLQCYPEFRLPFHSTLCFLGEMDESQKGEVKGWIDKKKSFPKITAKVKGVNYFKKDIPFAYFLELDSPDLNAINEELSIFSDIHQDNFAFLPHISLFFPKLKLTENDKAMLEEAFSDVKEITFSKVFLGNVVDHVTRIDRILNCL